MLFDHTTNDWRDVIQFKIDVSTAIFTGKYSDWLGSLQWMSHAINDAALNVYSKAEPGNLQESGEIPADLLALLDTP
ncbi:hypothetical protein HX787_21465 [Pseudomonas tolaasii]|uniref:Uncharacterized protein n=1 Tax=Pseudomonas tolaasii TaxID=29442 RepID=A0A7Y8DRD3_PSETO|nr:hypothetical protein [Pseudomonas tolaasii]ARB26689.1 hypothetical protein B5P22_05195 [Pseudomonas tolaasii]KAB0470580.1 hypothetical protein F7R12_20270 [Pseudomonas tolaasii]MBY8944056.1 hypothetical protein [Pseudomonas tolaasii]NVZ45385.1 hypothetical protein [Pseudomonas tolaasii]NWA48635.1 hypothetical protein [Pseudomonas tolaasii]